MCGFVICMTNDTGNVITKNGLWHVWGGREMHTGF
jgi:hypothetical protein